MVYIVPKVVIHCLYTIEYKECGDRERRKCGNPASIYLGTEMKNKKWLILA